MSLGTQRNRVKFQDVCYWNMASQSFHHGLQSGINLRKFGKPNIPGAANSGPSNGYDNLQYAAWAAGGLGSRETTLPRESSYSMSSVRNSYLSQEPFEA